ncbi:MAG: PDZ domain-containing protein [Candidatus Velthaea sp.]
MNPSGYLRSAHLQSGHLVVVTEDDLWLTTPDGGVARRLTASSGECSLPRLSPDGTTVAYVGRDEGHPELYTIPLAGGSPARITHLGSEALYLCGWSHDGGELHFTSDAGSPFVKETSAFAVALDGSAPRELAFGPAMTFQIATNGATLIGRNAIDPARWKRYRGGTAGHLWVDATGDGTFARLGRELNGNLVWPMWIGTRVYFLSDHEGIGNIYSCAADGSDLRAHTHESTYYARFPSTDGTRIVYTCGGELALLDTRDDRVTRIPIETPSSAPQTVRRFVDGGEFLESFAPSPDGTHVAVAARGRVFAMPLWEEAVTELGADTFARRRLAAWLPDGKRIAYVDDSGPFERVAIAALDEPGTAAYVNDASIGRITELVAAPSGDTLLAANHKHELLALAAGTQPRVLDVSNAQRITQLAISPDGRYVAYVWSPASETTIIRIAELETGTVHDATTALRTDTAPAWDPEGKYLYFISTRDFNPVYDALQFDLSFPLAARPFLVTLRRDVPNPFIPKPQPLHRASKDDDADDDKDEKDSKDERPAPIAVDFDGLAQRMLGFPVDEDDYDQIAGVKGRAVYSVFPVHGIRVGEGDERGGTLKAYDFEQERAATLACDIDGFVLGNDQRTLIYESHHKLRALDAGGDLPEDEPDDAKPATETNRRSGWIDLERIGVTIDPPAEWRQMYAEAWRLQREQFWDEGMSGIDWDAVYARYERLLPRLRTRTELSDLIWEMQGELGTSHAYEMGGDFRVPPQYKRGFLGADYRWDAALGGYRIETIYRGDSWDRKHDSPLAEPGLDVRPGDAIVAVGGRPVSRERTPDALLVNSAGDDVALTLAREGIRSRVVVKTLRDERTLRYRAWVEANRVHVHERTGGKVGYVHIPDMGPWGFAEFHRGYLSEFDRDGLIVDVRYNRGGHVSPLLLEKLARKRVGYDISRYGPPMPYPPESVAGPIVAITNQFAGSDGDIFSHCFKIYGLGPLVGMRTWGGVVGINPYHRLIDGTLTTQPEYSFWFSDVGWNVENYGTDPDYEVDVAPHDVSAGRDPQMDKALELITAAVEKHPGMPRLGPRPDRAHRR